MNFRVYLANEGEAAEQQEMPLDAFNAPCERRDKILASLVRSQDRGEFSGEAITRLMQPPKRAREDDPATDVTVQRVGKAASLDLAKSVHDPLLVDFLSTAWERWDAQAPRDPDFFGKHAPSHAASATPPLVPGNYHNRDACQMAGTSVASQCAMYATDRCAPIFAGLTPALLSDMGVLRAALSDMKGGECAASYALITHPGHHASLRSYGGYCYINSAAIAAKTLLSELSLQKVGVIDVDYHAGNGTIGIFWEDPSVFVCSIHADPDIDYPYTCGFAAQIGGGAGEGSTLCIPLPSQASWESHYKDAIRKAVAGVVAYGCEALVVSLGVDGLKGDPVAVPGAGFEIETADFSRIGAELRKANLPTIFVQEGGYDLDKVGDAVSNLLRGFCNPATAWPS